LLCNVLMDVFCTFGVPTLLSTADPEVALDRVKAVPIDLVMVEGAPDPDSMAFLKRLRTDPESPNPFVPVIICTDNTALRDVYRARDMGRNMGITEYLTKPVSANHVYSRIVSLIDHDRQFIKAGSLFGRRRQHHRLI